MHGVFFSTYFKILNLISWLVKERKVKRKERERKALTVAQRKIFKEKRRSGKIREWHCGIILSMIK